MTGASYRPASLVVSADRAIRPLNTIWSGLAQGHEVSNLRLDTVTGQIKPLGTSYVRIDHIYDGFELVGRVGGRLTYDWTKLDQLVGDITVMGAKPYFSLSYMPSAISRGDILDVPNEWGEWGQVVAATVGRYSRDYKGGLDNVIYEVWNEPDLFGGWKMYGDKSYVTMYTVASNAAVGVKNAKPFSIGGPATTGFYPAWVDGFYKKLDENVRIDFFSWHRYSANVEDFVKDAELAKEMIAPLITQEQSLYISEWGVNAERKSGYDSSWAGAHFLAVSAALEDTAVDMAMPFEIQDGVGIDGDGQFHGGWGMLTNPKFGAVVKKPRFKALEMISKLRGSKLAIAGQGDFVTGLAAAAENGQIRILAVNYDKSGKHKEVFPLTVAGLQEANYLVEEQYLSGRTIKSEILPVGGMMKREIPLDASEAVLITLTLK